VKVLVIGNGGREHALAWKLLQSKKINKLVCVPGNGGTATMPGCENLPLAVDDFAVPDYATYRYLTVVNTGNSFTTKYEVEVL
jgi:phosphoribosylamine--glycine ligase